MLLNYGINWNDLILDMSDMIRVYGMSMELWNVDSSWIDSIIICIYNIQ